MLQKMTGKFYEMAFQDPHLDKFIRSHDDPHGERFAKWIAEKSGEGTPWTRDRQARQRSTFHSHGFSFNSATVRSSAHFAAWHSPKRSSVKFGDLF